MGAFDFECVAAVWVDVDSLGGRCSAWVVLVGDEAFGSEVLDCFLDVDGVPDDDGVGDQV